MILPVLARLGPMLQERLRLVSPGGGRLCYELMRPGLGDSIDTGAPTDAPDVELRPAKAPRPPGEQQARGRARSRSPPAGGQRGAEGKQVILKAGPRCWEAARGCVPPPAYGVVRVPELVMDNRFANAAGSRTFTWDGCRS